MHGKNTQDSSPIEEKPSGPARKRLRYWLAGVVVTLLLVLVSGLLLSDFYLSSPAIIKKIQQVVSKRAGIKIEFQSIELDFFPEPSLALQQVNLIIPDYGQGKVAEINLSPAILPLLLGDLHLGRVSLKQPEFSVNLPAAKTQEPPAASSRDDRLQTGLAGGFATLGEVFPDFILVVSQGHFRIGRDQDMLETEDLDLRLVLSVADSARANATLDSRTAVFRLRRNGHQETLKGAELNASVVLDGETIRLGIKRLSLDNPGLEVSGKIEQYTETSSISMECSGRNIDVDATRRIALALFGDVEPVGEIFKYLRSGTVSQINVRSQGRAAKELGKLKNIRIEGKLHNASVSIPPIELDLTKTTGNVLVADGILHGTGMSTRLEGSTGHDGTLKIGLAEDVDLFQLELMLSADLAQAKRILERVVSNPEFIEEVNRITDLQGTGTGQLVLGDSLDNLYAEVDISGLNFTAVYQRIPFPIEVTDGQATFAENIVSVKNWQGTIGDSEFSELSCRVDLTRNNVDISHGLGDVEMRFDGTLGKNLVNWLSETFEVPKGYAIPSPMKVSEAELDWQEGSETTFRGNFSIVGGPEVSLDLARRPEQLTIHKLRIKDRYSEADLSLDYGTSMIAFTFNGVLQHQTLNGLFIEQDFGKGRVQGDFSVKRHETKPAGFLINGRLEGANLSFALPSGDELVIVQAVLAGAGDQLEVELSQLSWHDLTWDTVKATLDLSQDQPRVRVAEANLCGLDSAGVWTIDGEKLSLDVTLDGKALDVTKFYSCVQREQVKMTGTLALSGQLSGQGRIDKLIEILQGPLQATFSNGTIQQSIVLARTLEVLNVTEIVKGRLPSLSTTSFAYKTIIMQGELLAGKLLISKIEMDGETLDTLGEGEIDLIQKTVNVELLAAPFQTVDTIVKNIPGVNYLMAGSLVAIPVSITGPLEDPKVQVLSASSIGSSLLRLGERTIKSPLKLIEQFTPKKGGHHEKP